MTDLKYTILEKLYNAPQRSINLYALLNQFTNQINAADTALDDLIDKKFISCKFDTLRLIKDGVEAYESEYENREKEAKQAAEKVADKLAEAEQVEINKKQQLRRELFIAIVTALVSSALTLLVEHFPKLIDMIVSLFN